MKNLEEEFCFIIKDRSPQILDDIFELRNLNNFYLVPQKPVKLNDIYMDTDDFYLRNNKSALRVRFENDVKLVTYKREIKPNKREEKEFPYTPERFAAIRKKLNVLDKSLGCFHERTTQRRILKVKDIKKSKSYIADICLDEVQPAGLEVRFHEVEIEKKSEHHEAFLDITRLVRDRFKLIEWPYSKVTTCMGLDKLYRDNKKFRKTIPKSSIMPYSGFRLIKKNIK